MGVEVEQESLMGDVPNNNMDNLEKDITKVNEESKDFYCLTKTEVAQFATDKKWVRIRRILLAVFVLLWLLMLVSAVLIVVWSAKCPSPPSQDWFEVPYIMYVEDDMEGVNDLKRVEDSMKEFNTKSIVLNKVPEVEDSKKTKDKFDDYMKRLQHSGYNFIKYIDDGTEPDIKTIEKFDGIILKNKSPTKNLLEKVKEKQFKKKRFIGLLTDTGENKTNLMISVVPNLKAIKEDNAIKEFTKNANEIKFLTTDGIITDKPSTKSLIKATYLLSGGTNVLYYKLPNNSTIQDYKLTEAKRANFLGGGVTEDELLKNIGKYLNFGSFKFGATELIGDGKNCFFRKQLGFNGYIVCVNMENEEIPIDLGKQEKFGKDGTISYFAMPNHEDRVPLGYFDYKVGKKLNGRGIILMPRSIVIISYKHTDENFIELEEKLEEAEE
ncbi:hypothetical protein SNEBB_009600 [Seison nebaliae]|nr:hypothetical protein SNEBB_009600 [Seison nebaliae]